MQLHQHRERLDRQLLPQSELVRNSVWQVVFNSVEADQRTPHPLEVFILAMRGAQGRVLNL